MRRIFQEHLKNNTASRHLNTNVYSKFFQPIKRGSATKRRYFLQNLIYMLACTLIPLIILGICTSLIAINNVKKNVNTNNYNILEQFKSNIESTVNELDYMNVGISVNSTIYSLLHRGLTHEKYSTSINELRTTIKDFLIPLTVSRPYVHSMYIYMNNDYGRFITSDGAMVTLNNFHDTSWYNDYLKYKNSDKAIFCNPRSFQEYSFLAEKTQIVTLYKKFFVGEGVYVLNLSRSFFENEINKLSLLPNQSIIALNDDDEVLFHNNSSTIWTDDQLEIITKNDNNIIPTLVFNNEKFYIIQLISEKYGWKYISLIPHTSLYKSMFQFNIVIFLIILFTVVLCVILSYINVLKSFSNITSIISLFESAERNEPLPEIKNSRNDIYCLIMGNIANNYIQQNILKQQLANKQYQVKILEANSLQSQISPHFLFNSLKSIFWMSFKLTNSKNDVSTMIENMTDILDYSLTCSDSLVTFKSEIENCKNYISIQKMRHNNAFKTTWKYSPQIEDYYTIKLLLQPIIENCIMHAFTWQETITPHIIIKFNLKDDGIIIKVTDNGCGISESKLQKINHRLSSENDNGHIGIYNCHRRLALLFGNKYGLTIKSKVGFGTTVTVYLPRTRE